MMQKPSPTTWILWLIFSFTLFVPPALPTDFHVKNIAEFENALVARVNGQDDVIYLGAGTYQGSFSVKPNDGKTLVIKAEAGLSAQDVILDGGNTGPVL